MLETKNLILKIVHGLSTYLSIDIGTKLQKALDDLL